MGLRVNVPNTSHLFFFSGRGIVGENVLLLVGYITLQLPLQYIMLVESM